MRSLSILGKSVWERAGSAITMTAASGMIAPVIIPIARAYSHRNRDRVNPKARSTFIMKPDLSLYR